MSSGFSSHLKRSSLLSSSIGTPKNVWFSSAAGAARLAENSPSRQVIRPSVVWPTKGKRPRVASPAARPARYSFCAIENASSDAEVSIGFFGLRETEGGLREDHSA